MWIVAYDTCYAMVDRADDLKVGIKSTAILFGNLDRLMVGVLQAATVISLWLLGQRLGYGWFYLSALLVIVALFGYQQWLIRKRDPQDCFRAFSNNIQVGLSLFAGVLAETVVA